MRTPAVLALVLLLSSCSVYMAAKKEGTDFDDLSKCKTKTCLLANGAEPLNIAELPEGTEAYKVKKEHGSVGRAVMHGLLDIATWGIWEVAGTPIEGHYDKDHYYAIKVSYEKGTENIREIALAQ